MPCKVSLFNILTTRWRHSLAGCTVSMKDYERAAMVSQHGEGSDDILVAHVLSDSDRKGRRGCALVSRSSS